MNFQRRWIRRDWPTEVVDRPSEPYAYAATIRVKQGQDLDINLAKYISQGPVQVLEKPYFPNTPNLSLIHI